MHSVLPTGLLYPTTSATIAQARDSPCRIRKDSFQRILASGRKPCASDEALLAQAERLLHQEFSYVLHMNPEETVAFIREELEKAE